MEIPAFDFQLIDVKIRDEDIPRFDGSLISGIGCWGAMSKLVTPASRQPKSAIAIRQARQVLREVEQLLSNQVHNVTLTL